MGGIALCNMQDPDSRLVEQGLWLIPTIFCLFALAGYWGVKRESFQKFFRLSSYLFILVSLLLGLYFLLNAEPQAARGAIGGAVLVFIVASPYYKSKKLI